MSPNKPSHEDYLKRVQDCGNRLLEVPRKYRTPEICLAAVTRNGRALRFVPEEFRTPEICLAAFKNNVGAINFVPVPICQDWANKLWKPEPDPERSRQEKHLDLIRKNLCSLSQIPYASRTLEICSEALRLNPKMLQFVPLSVMTHEMCLDAVKRWGLALIFVPEEFRTPEMCLEAVKQDGFALESVLAGFRTLELCLLALRNAGSGGQVLMVHVPDHIYEQFLNDLTALYCKKDD